MGVKSVVLALLLMMAVVTMADRRLFARRVFDQVTDEEARSMKEASTSVMLPSYRGVNFFDGLRVTSQIVQALARAFAPLVGLANLANKADDKSLQTASNSLSPKSSETSKTAGKKPAVSAQSGPTTTVPSKNGIFKDNPEITRMLLSTVLNQPHISNMFSRFSFKATVRKQSHLFKSGEMSFQFRMSVSMSSNGQWDLRTEAIHKLKGGKTITAYSLQGRDFVLGGKDSAPQCLLYTPTQVFGETYGIEIPKKVTDKKDVLEFRSRCPFAECDYYVGRFNGELVTVGYHTKKKRPTILISRDAVLEISSWSSAPDRNWPSYPSQCMPTAAALKKMPSGIEESINNGTLKISKAAPTKGNTPNDRIASDKAPLDFGKSVFVFIEKSEEQVHLRGNNVENLLQRVPNSNYFRLHAPGLLDAVLTTTLLFRFHSNGRWQWTPATSPGANDWMSVGQMVSLSSSYKGRVPVDDNKSVLDTLLSMEKATAVGSQPLSDADIQFVLGAPVDASANIYELDVKDDTAQKMYYMHDKAAKKWKYSLSKTGGWSDVREDDYAITTPGGRAVNKWHKRTIKYLFYLQYLEQRSTTASTTCRAEHKGDGYCDTACNTAANNFDNGDCCPGTCESGRYPCGSNGYHCVSTGTNNGNLKKCIFFHGLGRLGPYPGGRSSGQPIGVVGAVSPPGATGYGVHFYWGNMNRELDGLCSHVLYAHADTVNNRWDNSELQDFYYNEALKIYNAGGVVFAHSMANVILAGACYLRGKCGVKWYDLGGPIRGSAAATLRANGGIQALYWFSGENLNEGTKSLTHTYKGMMAARDGTIDAVSKTAHDRRLILGVMCGTTGYGAGYATGDGLKWAKRLAYGDYECVRYGPPVPSTFGYSPPPCLEYKWIEADGFVGLNECERYSYVGDDGKRYWWYITGSAAIRDSSSASFLYKGNHQDMTGVYGNYDGTMDWYRARVRNHRKI